MKKNILLALSLLLPVPALHSSSDQPGWKFDLAHSNIKFTVTHLGLNRVAGSFGTFDGMIYFDPENPASGQVEAVIQVESVDTNNDKRDDHLRTDDFFDVQQFPAASFRSTEWKHLGDNRFSVTGDLQIMETTKPVTLEVELLGTAEVRGVLKSGWMARTSLDRYEWGVGGSGAFPIGREIGLEISIQADLQE